MDKSQYEKGRHFVKMEFFRTLNDVYYGQLKKEAFVDKAEEMLSLLNLLRRPFKDDDNTDTE